jgi:hypothetical protein
MGRIAFFDARSDQHQLLRLSQRDDEAALHALRSTAPARASKETLAIRRGFRDDENGASLILALVFLLAISVTVLSLTSWSANGLNDVAKFSAPATIRTAVNSAMEVAVASQRYSVTPTSITPTAGAVPAVCSSDTIPEGSASYAVTIWCGTVLNLTSSATRAVTFEACSGTPTGSVCAEPFLVANVTYDDYTFPISQILTTYCKSNCGTAETISSWVVSRS